MRQFAAATPFYYYCTIIQLFFNNSDYTIWRANVDIRGASSVRIHPMSCKSAARLLMIMFSGERGGRGDWESRWTTVNTTCTQLTAA